MAAKDRMAVLSAIMDQGVIPVFYHPDVEVCRKVVQACANGGAKCVEFTNRGDFAAQVFYEVTRHFAKADPSVILGVGSIVDAPTAALYINSGANFVVGPVLNPDVAQVCNRRKIPYSPGLRQRHRDRPGRGARLRDRQGLPGRRGRRARRSSRAVLGPCPWTRIMPTGGVEPHRGIAQGWFGAGVACVGMGCNLITKELLRPATTRASRPRSRDTLAMIARTDSRRKVRPMAD